MAELNEIAVNNSAVTANGAYTKTSTLQADNKLSLGPVGGMPTAKTGTITARTDGNTGVATLATGHGIVSTDRVDVYWTGGKRIGMIATVVGNDVSLEGGTGTDLPALTTAVSVCKVETIVLNLNGTKTVALLFSAGNAMTIMLTDAAGTVVHLQIDLVANDAYQFIKDTYNTSPITGDTVERVFMSHNKTDEALTGIRGEVFFDN